MPCHWHLSCLFINPTLREEATIENEKGEVKLNSILGFYVLGVIGSFSFLCAGYRCL